MKGKPSLWARILLVSVMLFGIAVVFWIGQVQAGNQRYKTEKIAWTELCKFQVEVGASVSDVKAAFRKMDREPIEELPEKQYDGTVRRHCVYTRIGDYDRYWPVQRMLIPSVYFDKNGRANRFEVIESGTGL